MNKNEQLGYLGAGLLFLGVFCPIVSVPIAGQMNYFQNGKGDGVVIVLLALVAVLIIHNKKYQALAIPGVGSLAMLGFTYVNFQHKMAQAAADMNSQLAGNPFRGLADLTLNSVQLQWGWAVLILGSLLVLLATQDLSDTKSDTQASAQTD